MCPCLSHRCWRTRTGPTCGASRRACNRFWRRPMADTEALREAKNFHEDVPVSTPGFFLRGAGSLDWGMMNRLARIFNPETARTVMLAIDHGYFQGPTTGLERVYLSIVPLMPMADALMLTR